MQKIEEPGTSKATPALDTSMGVPRVNGLLETKLYPRPTRNKLVARPRITALLDAGLSATLVLVSAPAGFGKTTLLSEWLKQQPYPFCWLSLDAADNDPARFWAYVILSLQGIRDELGEIELAQLRSPQPPPIQQILPNLLEEIDSFHDRGILVLDDFHVITSTAVNGSLAYLLENLPPDIHLVISTRSDPPIPIAKLRSRGQVLEIRADELRFTSGEAAAFLNQTMGLALSSEQVAALDERTEGWIAGLQMAALSMRGRDAERVDGFIRAFAGTHRFIMDYLLEEVLARESEEVQTFLLQTAILARLTGPLCDAVTGASYGQEMLDRLERRNLFVVPLDDDRTWYRYHHLFADLLRTQLQKSLGDGGVARLHLRASEWYEQHGSVLEAIDHSSLASDFARVEHLIERHYLEMMNRGEMASIRFWMGKLSKEVVHRRPWLCLYEAFSRSWFGQLEEASLMLDEAESRIRSHVTAPDTQAMTAYHAYVKSRVTAMLGDTRRAIELCLAARENTPPDNLGMQIEIGITLGYEYFLVGDFVNAASTLNEMIHASHAVGAVNNPVAAYALLARVHIIQGLLREASDLYQKAAHLVHEAGDQYLGAIGLVEAGMADLLCERNDLESALVRVRRGLDFLPWWGKADDLALGYCTLSRILLAQENRTEAAGAVEKAVQITKNSGVFSEARSAVETAQVRLWLVEGDWPAVDRWAITLEKRFGPDDPFRYEDELTHLTQAKVLIAQSRLDEAIQVLARLEEIARSCGRNGRLAESMILRASAMQKLGNVAETNIALTESLAIAEPEGYLRIFLDEGQSMQRLLSQWLDHSGAGPLKDYAIHLLSQFGAELQVPTAAQEKGSESGDLIEPLTPRELQVLHLICAGDSNQMIADKLVITLSAVKKHTGNILGKLSVTSRAQAMVKARQLGLLPKEN